MRTQKTIWIILLSLQLLLIPTIPNLAQVGSLIPAEPSSWLLDVRSAALLAAPVARSLQYPRSAERHLFIVAHHDDDLLFFNPDIDESIRAGNTVKVVVMTNQGVRIKGLMNAYAFMAGKSATLTDSQLDEKLKENWTYTIDRVNKSDDCCTYITYHLNNRPISLTFFRFADGGPEGRAAVGLDNVWKNEDATTVPCDSSNDHNHCPLNDVVGGASQNFPRQTYTRAYLIDTLTQIMNDFQPDRINAMDSSGMYAKCCGPDKEQIHSDHLYSACFAFVAHQRYSSPHSFWIYRDYSINLEEKNLYSETGRKREMFEYYLLKDPEMKGEGVDKWLERRYAIAGPRYMPRACDVE